MEPQKDDIGWAKIELMGHNVLYGYVRESQVAGEGMLRVDVPNAAHPPAGCKDGPFSHTSYYHPKTLYGLHPIAADVCVALAKQQKKQPVERWDLPEEMRNPPRALPAGEVFIDDAEFLRPERGVVGEEKAVGVKEATQWNEDGGKPAFDAEDDGYPD